MALIIDPDDLSQGTETAVSDMVFTVPGTGADAQLTSAGTNLPALAANEFFEIRDHSDPDNNGLYEVITVNTSTSDYEIDKVDGSAPNTAGSEAATTLGATGASTEKSVHVDVGQRKIYLLEQGNLSTDGCTLQAVYSFLKEEWKDDDVLIPYDFPMTAITPEQFEFNFNWVPQDNTTPAIQTRKLIRTGGWQELSADNSNIKAEYIGVISLGTFEDDTNDLAYYQVGDDPTDTAAATDFTFAGPLNEAILVYDDNVGPDAGTGFDFNNDSPDTIDRNDGGSWITDGYVVGGQITVQNANTAGNNGTYEITVVTAGTLTVTAVGGGDAGLTTDLLDMTATFARNYRAAIKLFLRVRDGDPNGKLFASSNLAAIGITGDVTNQVYRFPLSNATDLKISETDANVSTISPYTQIVVRYFDQAFTLDIGASARSFGIVVDVGTHSGVDGATAAAGLFTSSEGAIADDGRYENGTLSVHEGSDKGDYTIGGTAPDVTATTVTITTTFPNQPETNLSFTIQRATPITATAEEIYEKVQYLLRQASDIDSTDQVVTGKTADALLTFVGDNLNAGDNDSTTPVNPNGGGTGVYIAGFDSNDTNRLFFFDNGGVSRNFPFVAAGTINFNDNLQNDTGPAKYWMFYDYTARTTVSDLALSAASGATASLDSAGAGLPTLVQNDYIRLGGMTEDSNNGVWRVTDASPSTTQADVEKYDLSTAVNESSGSKTLDQNPVDSPDAIIVDNNSAADITGTIGGPSVAFDFDYENNTQGGRTADTDANIILRAIGTDTGSFVEATGTITKTTGQSFSLVAGLERNYSNP